MKYLVSYKATVNPEPKALIVTCFDPKIKGEVGYGGVDEFIDKTLKLKRGQFVLKSIGGGPLPLAHPETLKSRCKLLVRHILFAIDEAFSTIEEVVIIMHCPCAYYGQTPPECHGEEKEKRDLPLVGSLIQGILQQGKRARLIFADLVENKTKLDFYEAEIPRNVVVVPSHYLPKRQPQLA